MKTIYKSAVLLIVFLIFSVQSLHAHCEIPCGIYDDEARIKLIQEHIGTIAKSMKQIIELSKDGDKNYNQLVRWIMNKEDHANMIQDIVIQYFLTQRIKSSQENPAKDEKYLSQLAMLHSMLVQAMKCKQTTDLIHTENLQKLVTKFEILYFGEDHQH